MDPTVLSLCSGYAGLDIGLHAALGGGRTVGYVEREAYAAAVLLARMEEQTLEPAPVWCGNLEDCDYTPFHGVDWVTAGFPCQPWSSAGSRKGTDDERWLWPSIVSCLREVRPRWVLLENVRGLVSGGGLGPVLGDLAGLGFDAEWGLFSAAQVGASHQRERVFIVAHHNGEKWRPAQGQPDAEHDGRDHAGRGGEELADTTEQRRPGDGEAGLRAVGAEHDGRGEELADTGRLFAPGPADLDVWARVLTETPEVEPSLCRVAHGSTPWLEYRQDRLRALGNGVCPLQAAVAVRVLADRAGWGLM